MSGNLDTPAFHTRGHRTGSSLSFNNDEEDDAKTHTTSGSSSSGSSSSSSSGANSNSTSTAVGSSAVASVYDNTTQFSHTRDTTDDLKLRLDRLGGSSLAQTSASSSSSADASNGHSSLSARLYTSSRAATTPRTLSLRSQRPLTSTVSSLASVSAVHADTAAENQEGAGSKQASRASTAPNFTFRHVSRNLKHKASSRSRPRTHNVVKATNSKMQPLEPLQGTPEPQPLPSTPVIPPIGSLPSSNSSSNSSSSSSSAAGKAHAETDEETVQSAQLASKATHSFIDWLLANDHKEHHSPFTFIEYLHQHPNSSEFVYLNPVRSSHTTHNPYQLTIVTHDRINEHDYFTLSRLGVTHFVNGEADFTSLEQWQREQLLFSRVMSIAFFKKFRLWKAFSVWKKNIRNKRINEHKTKLEDSLFILHPTLSKALLNVRDHCCDMLQMRLYLLRSGKTYSLPAFLEEQKHHKNKMGEELKLLSDTVQQEVYESCDTVLLNADLETNNQNAAAAQQEAANSISQFSGKDSSLASLLNPKVAGIGVGGGGGGAYMTPRAAKLHGKTLMAQIDTDVQTIKMSFTQIAHKGSLCRRLTNFIRLCDYLVIDALHLLTVDSVEDMLMAMTPQKAPAQKAKTIASSSAVSAAAAAAAAADKGTGTGDDANAAGGAGDKAAAEADADALAAASLLETKVEKVPTFSLRLILQSDDLMFDPSMYDMQDRVDLVIQDFTNTVSVNVGRMITNDVFRPFTNPTFNERTESFEYSEGPVLSEIIWKDDRYQRLISNMKNAIGHIFQEADKYGKSYDFFRDIYVENRTLDMERLRSGVQQGLLTLDNLRDYMIKFAEQSQEIAELPEYRDLGIVRVIVQPFKDVLEPSPRRVVSDIHKLLPVIAYSLNKDLLDELNDANVRLLRPPDTVEDFVSHLAFLQDITSRQRELKQKFKQVSNHYDMMAEYDVQVPEEEKAAFQMLQPEYTKLKASIQIAEASKDANIARFSTELSTSIQKLRGEVLELKSASQNAIISDDRVDDLQMVLTYLNKLIGQVEKLDEQAKRYSYYQELFNKPITKYDNLETLKHDLSLKKLLWQSRYEWEELTSEWTTSQFDAINADEIQSQTLKYHKIVRRLDVGLPNNPVVKKLKEAVDEFKLTLPVVLDLRNPALQQRHWERIEDIIQRNVVRDETFTLGLLLNMKVMDYKDEISMISTEATQEALLIDALDTIRMRWAETDFIVNKYPGQNDAYTLGSVEDIMILLEDSIISISTISGSRYVDPIREEVEQMDRDLRLFQATLDEWLVCQRQWRHLEAIFAAVDMQRHLSSEYKAFLVVDKTWKDIMMRTKEYPNALQGGITPGLLETFQKSNEHLEKIKQKLEEFLETKRRAFPRFYFLSDTDMLQILSQSKKPQAVQPHLRKCFTNIDKLQFAQDSKSTDVNAMISGENERVTFLKAARVRYGVEEWLKTVEKSMHETLKKIMKNALGDFETSERAKWVLAYPAQIVLTVWQIFWARDVQMALAGDNTKTLLQEKKRQMKEELSMYASMVAGRLNDLQRITVVTLITIVVHARDIVAELIEGDVDSVTDYDWINRLRYYWDDKDDQCVVRQGTASFNYRFEYLGATTRLVITPLTDRCYMTLTSALNMHLGGSPAGPAGTGKTETVKDLAKALAVQCVVFNCGEGVRYAFMEQFFKGLCQAGAWACFDEFNRIDIEVLSVIASMLQTIQTALSAESKTFNFGQGDVNGDMPLEPSFGCFVTMNPGYSGRTELPDNLKALFRPVAMMIPNYELIAENLLYSQGFEDARNLSHKMVKLYKLSSEQLSQQKHYDFGLRAVKSVLNQAGKMKRANKGMEEEKVLIRAMKENNIPKFLQEDVVLFEHIIKDLFPTTELPAKNQGEMKDAIEEVLQMNHLQPKGAFIDKVLQLHETLQSRFGVMLIGPTMSGKTTCYQTLQQAMTMLHERSGHEGVNPNLPYNEVQTYVLNPKAISLGELYGESSEVTKDFKPGVMSAITEACLDVEENNFVKWVVFDGPVDANWIENMNSVLDDSRVLCLPNGDRIILIDTMHMLFEVEDLHKASPATVSRCGMVYMPEDTIGWRPYVRTWMDTRVTLFTESVREQFYGLFEEFVDRGLYFVSSKCTNEVPVTPFNMVVSLCSMLESVLLQYDTPMQTIHPPVEEDEEDEDGGRRKTTSIWDDDGPGQALGGGNGGNGGGVGSSSSSSSSASGGTNGVSAAGAAALRARGNALMDMESDDEEEDEQRMMVMVTRMFTFAFIWSMGGNLTEQSRQLFDDWARGLFADVVIPPQDTVFDYFVEVDADGDAVWMSWADVLPSFEYDPATPSHQVLVPTVDTLRYQYMMEACLRVDRHVLLTGVTGTGKSVIADDFFRKATKKLAERAAARAANAQMAMGGMTTANWQQLLKGGEADAKGKGKAKNGEDGNDGASGNGGGGGGGAGGGAGRLLLPGTDEGKEDKSPYKYVTLHFSARTSAQSVQQAIEDNYGKRGRNVFGPPAGKKLVLFVDDINMPFREESGAQPPIELLRQYLDFGGFYDREEWTWKNVIDVLIVAACAPPGGGRNEVTPRFFRHFNMYNIPATSEDSMRTIFSAIVGGWLKGADYDLQQLVKPLVHGGVDVFVKIKEGLRPRPEKSHYTFNLRDMGKMYQGILSADLRSLEGSESMIRLWVHENMRVFHDRLINNEDRRFFTELLVDMLRKHFNVKWSHEALFEEERILFGDFMRFGVSRDERTYEEIQDKERLLKVLEQYLVEYNTDHSQEMNLVFFQDAIDHVCRICRVLRQPSGHAMLVGVGGCGKQSLTRLACGIMEYHCKEIQGRKNYAQADFHEDLRSLYLTAGVLGEPVVFLFPDTKIRETSFLEDVNMILNSGEVPHLFEAEDLDKVISDVRPMVHALGLPETQDSIYRHFIERVKENLHVVLCMSPVGSNFREWNRQFPSLINCCTIDWFDPWPEEALLSVSQHFLQDTDLGSAQMKSDIARLCVDMHLFVTEQAEEFFAELRRRFYTTPKSYLELINLYLTLLESKRDEIGQARDRLLNGLKRLQEANEDVFRMEKHLNTQQPILKEKAAHTEQLLQQLAVSQDNTDQLKKVVQSEEAMVKQQTQEIEMVAQEAKLELDQVMPAFEAAAKAVNELDKKDIGEIKSFKTPPRLVKMVMEAVCILFQRKPDWETSKRILTDTKFAYKLLNYNKEGISDQVLRRLRKYVDDPDFQPRAIRESSEAAYSLCMWVRAIDEYATRAKKVEPKRRRVAEAEVHLKQSQDKLASKQQQLMEIERKLNDLRRSYEMSLADKVSHQQDLEVTAQRLRRASKLTTALADEQERWSETAAGLQESMTFLVGDVFVSAAAVAYCGPFTGPYRAEMVSKWVEWCESHSIPISADFSLRHTLSKAVDIRQWNVEGLPTDTVSIDNAIMVTQGRRWPLMIDPQKQANRWIKQMEGDRLTVLKPSSDNVLRTLEACIHNGKPVLLEDCGEELDPALEPLLNQEVVKVGQRHLLRLGDQDIDYDLDFKFYMTTPLSNPHYLPDVCNKVTIINFTVTMEGLQEQLVNHTVAHERPELEKQKNHLVETISNDKKKVEDIEDTILRLLNQGGEETSILDDETMINTLNEAKMTAVIIQNRLKETQEIEASLAVSYDKYRSVAERGSLLYFVTADMGAVDPMYQYSLQYFTQLFTMVLRKTEESDDLETRLDMLNTNVTRSIYRNICRGLFESHKPMFAFLIASQIQRQAGEVSTEEWNLLVRGAVMRAGVVEGRPVNPDPGWISAKEWNFVCTLSEQFPEVFGELPASMAKDNKAWYEWQDLELPYAEPLPQPWEGALTPFQKLLLLRAIREEKLVYATREFTIRSLGEEFGENMPLSLEKVYPDTSPNTPVIFVLSTGADPVGFLKRFAGDMEMGDRMQMRSLGQGQGEYASEMIRGARKSGDWVLLQNCHLATSWMPELEKIVNDLQWDEALHPSFRLWLTSMPSKDFPVSVLQNGIKLTHEPPRGIKANMARTFADFNETMFESARRPKVWKKLLYSLAFFNAVIQERRKFGPLGWNIRYEFNQSDLDVSLVALRMLLEGMTDDMTEEDIPWKALRSLTGDILYGGRVTDDWDRRCMMSILDNFYNPVVLEEGYAYATVSEQYSSPAVGTLEQYRAWVNDMPATDAPELFGMSENADMVFQLQESSRLVNTIVQMQPRVTRGGGSASGKAEEMVHTLAGNILELLPADLDMDEAGQHTFAVTETGQMDSLATALSQEMVRYNNLLAVLRSTLVRLRRAIVGEEVMSAELETMFNSLLSNQVPERWQENAYTSMKPLGSWVTNLVERVAFMRDWLRNGAPTVYCISYFFFPQGFLTGVLQRHARTYKLAIDQLEFQFEVMDQPRHSLVAPQDGVFVDGMYLEAGRWDAENHVLTDAEPGDVYSEMPVVYLLPSSGYVRDPESYQCPLYKTSARAGVLSTTGLSTNFVLAIDLPQDKEDPEYWTLQGTALICQLST